MTSNPALALGAAILTIGVSACGGSSSSSSSTTTTSPAASSSAASAPAATTAATSSSGAADAHHQTIAADPSGQLKFTKAALSAAAGKITVAYTNNAPEAHNLMIQQGSSGPIVAATPTFQGGTKTVSAALKPGTYTYFCGVPGHRAGGMQGTLTVR